MTQSDNMPTIVTIVEEMFTLTKDYLKRKSELEHKPDSDNALLSAGITLKARTEDLWVQLVPYILETPELWVEYRRIAPADIRQTLPELFPKVAL